MGKKYPEAARRVNKRLQYLTYTDTAREYTAHNLAKNGLHVNVLDYCVDPTGGVDCTDQLNKLAERLYWLGGGSIELPAGIYKVSHPFIHLLDKVEFFGHGMSTRIIATSTDALTKAAGTSDECFGVFIRELIKTRHLMRQITVRCVSECVICGFARAPKRAYQRTAAYG